MSHAAKLLKTNCGTWETWETAIGGIHIVPSSEFELHILSINCTCLPMPDKEQLDEVLIHQSLNFRWTDRKVILI